VLPAAKSFARCGSAFENMRAVVRWTKGRGPLLSGVASVKGRATKPSTQPGLTKSNDRSIEINKFRLASHA